MGESFLLLVLGAMFEDSREGHVVKVASTVHWSTTQHLVHLPPAIYVTYSHTLSHA